MPIQPRRVRGFWACGAVALLAAAGTAQATWSIILTDSETKEIAIGSCTCLTNFDLRENTPVMIVGIGGATAQGLVDSACVYRMQIHDLMVIEQMDPALILSIITGSGNAESRQFGIVDTVGRPATFTGSSTNDWAGGLGWLAGLDHVRGARQHPHRLSRGCRRRRRPARHAGRSRREADGLHGGGVPVRRRRSLLLPAAGLSHRLRRSPPTASTRAPTSATCSSHAWATPTASATATAAALAATTT